MYRLLLIISIFSFTISFGADKYGCVHIKNSKSDPTKKYPFSVSDKIVWASWKNSGKERPKTIRYFTTDSIHWSAFSDTALIAISDKPSLAAILFNYRFAGKSIDLSASCYIPRDALLFLDKDGKLIDYLEVCFECTGYRLGSDKWNLSFCEDKFGLLSSFKEALFKK